MEYFHSVPRAPRWFTPSSLKTTVRIQQIVHPNLNLVEISETNMLPNGCNKRFDEEEIEDTADGDESDEDENDEEVSDVRR
mmetsp:Transcript_30705/g.50714  ORF Transcript_30705/g.50714 Transcript_30705/m.50714 type:complete len:81 (-) Transcript_30705:74-316(-)